MCCMCGSYLLSSDLLVSLYLNPAIKAYAFKDYRTACVLLYSFNKFFLSFKIGIDNLPAPNNPDRTDTRDRRRPDLYYITYFEKYAPMISGILGTYQNTVLKNIKDEHEV